MIYFFPKPLIDAFNPHTAYFDRGNRPPKALWMRPEGREGHLLSFSEGVNMGWGGGGRRLVAQYHAHVD